MPAIKGAAVWAGKADALRGRTIEFRGAALVGAAMPEIVPVTLQVRPEAMKGAAP